MSIASEDRVTLLTRRACQLCGPARSVVAEACRAAGESFTEVDVDSDPELRAEFGDQVPVVLLDGEIFATLIVEPADLAQALARR